MRTWYFFTFAFALAWHLVACIYGNNSCPIQMAITRFASLSTLNTVMSSVTAWTLITNYIIFTDALQTVFTPGHTKNVTPTLPAAFRIIRAKIGSVKIADVTLSACRAVNVWLACTLSPDLLIYKQRMIKTYHFGFLFFQTNHPFVLCTWPF